MEKLIVIGLGSMGKRRIRLLNRIDSNIEIIGVDGRADRRDEVEKLGKEIGIHVTTCENLSFIEDSQSICGALICTSPLAHAAIIKECVERGYNVFSEINLVADGYTENIRKAKEKGLLLYLSSTPMFRKEINYITGSVHSCTDKLNYIFHVGQYLPDWHPWESYKDFFISNPRTNGCREIMAIEFPWLIRCFGKIDGIQVSSSRQTALDIDFNDSYNLIITHENGNRGVFVVDVVCRNPVRYFEVSGEHLFITWDGKPNGIKEYNFDSKSLEQIDLYEEVFHREGYNNMIIEDAYEAEIRDFIKSINGEKNPEYTFEKDIETLKLIDEVEACRN